MDKQSKVACNIENAICDSDHDNVMYFNECWNQLSAAAERSSSVLKYLSHMTALLNLQSPWYLLLTLYYTSISQTW